MEFKEYFMLCESMQDEKEINLLDKSRWKAQVKYDGERVMCAKKGNDIILFNRRGNIINFKFNEVVKSLSLNKNDFIIDGEIISLDNNFNNLQKRALTKDKNKIKLLEKQIPVKFMVFDILSLNNEVVMKKPLSERYSLLQNLGIHCGSVEVASYGEINDILTMVIKNNGEGIVIKDMNSVYENKRSKNWFKHKLFKETTLTITGFSENNAGIRATDEKGNAVQISGQQSIEVKRIIENAGYADIQVQYLEITKENKLRFPSYRGLK